MPRDRMLSDAQWAKISPLHPDRPSPERPWRDNREGDRTSRRPRSVPAYGRAATYGQSLTCASLR